jgi:alcohol dehydrogenase class IV
MPNGIGALGYGDADVAALAEGAYAQQRLLANSPVPVSEDDLQRLYRGAASYW